MKYKNMKTILVTGFLLSVLGWGIFAIFFAPEDFFTSSEPPVSLSTDTFGLLNFFLFMLGVGIPILCLFGLAVLSILRLHERRKEVSPNWIAK